MKERESGFYWVKRNSSWIIAYFENSSWHIFEPHDEHEGYRSVCLSSGAFKEIDESPIKRCTCGGKCKNKNNGKG